MSRPDRHGGLATGARPFLTCVLYAPIGSMGAVATGPDRLGWERPARSAVIGLVAACLGIERWEDEAHLALDRDLGMAMLVERSGEPFIDFHTVRAPSGSARYATRRDEVAAVEDRDDPVVSRREYRSGVVVLLALWAARPGVSLPAVQAAMLRPKFLLCMGRRSCPLGLPLAPRIEDAASPLDALAARQENGPEREFLPRSRPGPCYAAMDAADAAEFLGQGRSIALQVETRADRIASRRRWQFLPRAEAIVPWPMGRQAEDEP